ncbi:hypothetical protein [Ramlibacter sp. PS4R-6]|uniref:hypothetical protein n=1 Tax=Ramlibacter sp. PS4R-6 TaxID=3133438 RepID=UPI0030AD0170
MEDTYHPGSVIAAWLSPAILGELEPMLRRLLVGQQLFVKQDDGTYRPKGCQFGLARSFAFADLNQPTLRPAGI